MARADVKQYWFIQFIIYKLLVKLLTCRRQFVCAVQAGLKNMVSHTRWNLRQSNTGH